MGVEGMLSSRHFKDDPVLEDIAADRDRISRTRHASDPAVGKIQTALLLVLDPGCLPVFGPDGNYGDETATAIRRFKVEVLHVPPGEVIDDVGPQTVLELDRLMRIREQSLDTAARITLLDGWLNVPVAGGVSSIVNTSGVHIHPNGESAFRALHDAITRCTGENTFIVIAGWDFFTETPLVPGVTAGTALTDAANRGVRVRAMLSHFPVINTPIGPISAMAGDNAGRVAFVNGLLNGAAIHDQWVLHHDITVPGPIGSVHVGIVQVGMHHQKIWIVFDGERLQAFCGGVDINPNRTAVDKPTGSPPPFHDVQVELSGPAAVDVYGIVRSRWNDHPQRPTGVELPRCPPASRPPRSGPGSSPRSATRPPSPGRRPRPTRSRRPAARRSASSSHTPSPRPRSSFIWRTSTLSTRRSAGRWRPGCPRFQAWSSSCPTTIPWTRASCSSPGGGAKPSSTRWHRS